MAYSAELCGFRCCFEVARDCDFVKPLSLACAVLTTLWLLYPKANGVSE